MCHSNCQTSRRPVYKARHNVQGIGLPASIFIVLILALIVLALSDLTQTSTASVSHNYQAQKAFFAAESGAQIGLNRMFVGGASCAANMGVIDFNSTTPNTGLAACRANLACIQNTVLGQRYYTLLSQGVCGEGFEQAQRTVQVRARSN